MELFVAVNGNDEQNGSKNEPIRTLSKAMELVRAVDKGVEDKIDVYIQSGTYFLENTLKFTNVDSGSETCPISYIGEGEVIISGARRVDVIWEKHTDSIYKTKVDIELQEIDQLFINHKKKIMARYPNYDETAKYFDGFAADSFSEERTKHYKNPSGGLMHVMHQGLWGDFHYRITGRDENHQLEYVGGWQNNRPSPMHETIRFIENIFEELDAPNEWYFDAVEKMLYYMPEEGEELEHAVVEIVTLQSLLCLEGEAQNPITNITFSNLNFTQVARTFMEEMEPALRSDWCIYRGGVIYVNHGEYLRFEQCNIREVGGNGIVLDGCSEHLVVQGCEMENIGASSVLVLGDFHAMRSPLFFYGDLQEDGSEIDLEVGENNNCYPKNCSIIDNLLVRNGRVEKQSAGVSLVVCKNITIRNNTIYDVPRAGINLCCGCFGGHIIEDNVVFDTVKETSDHGAFNSWGRDRFWDCRYEVMRENLLKNPEMPLLDAMEPVIIRGNIFECQHGWDIDLDDGSSNYLIEENLCLHGGIKNREGVRRIVRNNIMYQNTFHPHVWFDKSEDVFVSNIIFKPYKDVRLNGWGAEFDYNMICESDEIKSVEVIQEQSNMDSHSICCAIQFRDVQNGDFTIVNKEILSKVNFRERNFQNVGVLRKELKAKAKTPFQNPLKGMKGETQSDKVYNLGGILIKRLSGMSEVSATGMYEERGFYVISINESGKWYETGIRAHDVILEIDSKEVESISELETVVVENISGITVWRNQGKMML